MKFIRLTEGDGLVIYIPIHSIKDISIEENIIEVTYGDNHHFYPIETEAEIIRQINQ